MRMETNAAVMIEIPDSDDEDNGNQHVPAVNDAITTSRLMVIHGDFNLEHQQADVARAASPEPDLNEENEILGVEHEAAIVAPVGSQCPLKKLSPNFQKQPKRDANGCYKCTVCEYSSRERGNFKRHQLKHRANAVKPFKCEHCDYTAREKCNLIAHQRTHARQKQLGVVQNPENGQRLFNCANCICDDSHKKSKKKNTRLGVKNVATNVIYAKSI